MTAKQLRELRAKAHDSAKALMKAADDESRALTDDEQTAFDGYIAEAEKLDKQITSRESLDTMAAKIDKPDTRVAGSEAFSGDADSQDTDSGGEPEMRVLPQFEEDYRRDQQQQQRLYLPARVRSRGRLQAFTGERADENAFVFGHWLLGAISPHEPRRHFSQALCRDLGLSFELRAQTEGVNTAGGYLVPSQFENVIIRVVEQFGLARRECKILPMSSDKIDQPKGTGEATVTFVGETTDYTETNLTYGLVEYVAKKLTALTYVSNEIQEDALIPIIDDVVMAFGRGFAAKEDDCLFNGDGTSSFGGIVGIRTLMIDGNHAGSYNDATANDDQWPEYIDTDLIGMMGETPFQGDEFDDEKWYCSKIAAYQTFGRLLRAAGGVQLAALAGAIPLFYGGAPVVISQKMPKVTTALNQVVVFIYGNMRQAVTFADRRGITVALDTSVKFISDQIAIKASERFDIKVHSIGDATNAGPLFGLRGTT